MFYGKPALPSQYNNHYGVENMPVEQTDEWLCYQKQNEQPSFKESTDDELMQRVGKAHQLTLNSIRKGMLLLGCVTQIRTNALKISLPGGTRGIVPEKNISAIYSKRLRDAARSRTNDCLTLNDLYAVGDLVYAKVEKNNFMPRKPVILTLDPYKLHETFQPSQLVPGLVLAATITNEVYHGYTMELGVRNVLAFLPRENLNENRDDVGRNLFCSIVSVKMCGKLEVTLKAFHPDEPRVLNVDEAAMETIVPGCQLTFTVGEPVEYGLRGMLFEDSVIAYVNENMLTKVTSSKEKYSMFKRLPATLLYRMPVTNEVYVSLRPYPNNRAKIDPAYSPGTIIENACVKSHDVEGNVWLQFENKRRALLLRGDLINIANASPGSTVDQSVILSNYQVGSTHKVGVMFVDPLENIPIVTKNMDLLDEAIQDISDIVIGKTYKCRVTKKLEGNGVLVTIGGVKGKAVHKFYDKKSNLKYQDIVPMRAVSRQEGKDSIYLTNHPLLMDESAPILKDWEQLETAGEDKTFLGLVCFTDRTNPYVRFFNNMSGILNPMHAATELDMVEVSKLRPGSVKLFTVIGYNKEKKQIDLILKRSDYARSTAQLVNVTVIGVQANGVNVRDENGEEGTIAADCFSEFGEHNSLYMRLLREGETLSAVKIHSGQYSVRLTQYFQENPTEMANVQPGMLLKASCVTVNGELYAVPTLSDFTARIPITDQLNYRKIEDGSIIKMRVVDLDRARPTMTIRTRDVDVCEDMFVDIHCFMTKYLQDVTRLIDRYRELGLAFAHHSIGDQVECVVEGIVPEYNKMAVAVDAVAKRFKFTTRGIVSTVLPDRPASAYSVGQKLSGRVVWIDVEKRLVHVCVDEALFERIMLRKELETVPNEERECWILFTNYFINVCCVKDGPTCPLVIVPAKYHYNDFVGDVLDGHTVTAHLKQQLGSMILGVETTIYRHYIDLSVELRNTSRERHEQDKIKIPTQFKLVRCSTVPATYDTLSDDSEAEEKKGKGFSDSIGKDKENELHGNGESDNKSTSIPASDGNGIYNTNQSSPLPSKKVVNELNLAKTEKRILKRRLGEEENLNGLISTALSEENLLTKKKVPSIKGEPKQKKKKIFLLEEPEMKQPYTVAKEEPKKKKKKKKTLFGLEEPEMKEPLITAKESKKNNKSKGSVLEELEMKEPFTAAESPKKKKKKVSDIDISMEPVKQKKKKMKKVSDLEKTGIKEPKKKKKVPVLDEPEMKEPFTAAEEEPKKKKKKKKKVSVLQETNK